MRSAWEWIKAIFSPPRPRAGREPDEMFTPIDVEEVGERLRLGEEAARFGGKNLPARDDVELDGPQKRLQQFINEAINTAFRRANVELERLDAALRERDIEPLVVELEQAPARAEERIARRTGAVDREVSKLEAERTREQERLDRYRTRYGIQREPDLKDAAELRFLVIWTIALAFGQAMTNTLFFAQGIRWGLAAGLGVAFLLGAFDVVMHYLVGRVGSRIHAPGFLDRLVGGFMTGLAVLTVPVWNLGIVHLRNGVRFRGFEQGVEQWLPTFLADPFGFTDFTSWALLAIGVLCSISAVVTGWKWDEPVPVLRAVGRKLRDIDDELRGLREYRAGIEHDEKDALEEERAALRERIEVDLQASENIVARMKRLRENLYVFVDDAERAFHALIQRYRDENRLARSTEPPEYFHRRPEIDTTHPLDLEMSVLNERLEAQRALRERVQTGTVARSDRPGGGVAATASNALRSGG